jgi:hypothetical protein
MGIPLQGHFPTQTMNPMFATSQPSQQKYMGGPTGVTIPSQPVYGPTSTSMAHPYYQYPQPNRQLPFLATLDLLDFFMFG